MALTDGLNQRRIRRLSVVKRDLSKNERGFRGTPRSPPRRYQRREFERIGQNLWKLRIATRKLLRESEVSLTRGGIQRKPGRVKANEKDGPDAIARRRPRDARHSRS
jgi:hypothetical protein